MKRPVECNGKVIGYVEPNGAYPTLTNPNDTMWKASVLDDPKDNFTFLTRDAAEWWLYCVVHTRHAHLVEFHG